MSPRRLLALVLLATGAGAGAFACGAGEAEGPPALSPEPSEVEPPRASPPARARRRRPLEEDASVATPSAEDAATTAPSLRLAPEPAYGATESARPLDPHAFRMGAALRALRATPSGAKVLKVLSMLPDIITARKRTGVDPFEDAEWLLVYGPELLVPGANANVVRHARSEAVVSLALQDGGLEAWDAGAQASAGTTGALRGELLGVRDVLLRPQPGMLALVPGDRARDLAAELVRPVEAGLRAGELVRIEVASPSAHLRVLPADVVRATVSVKAAADGGLDASAEADCADAVSCKATATALDELVARGSRSFVVRMVTRNVLSGVKVRAVAAKVRVNVHAAPDQVDALLNLLRAQLGLPAADPGRQSPLP